jgi:hypothetical protein
VSTEALHRGCDGVCASLPAIRVRLTPESTCVSNSPSESIERHVLLFSKRCSYLPRATANEVACRHPSDYTHMAIVGSATAISVGPRSR